MVEFRKRPHDLAAGLRRVVELQIPIEALAVAFYELGLGVKQIDLARAAEHVHRDHRARLRLVWRRLRQEVVHAAFEFRLLERRVIAAGCGEQSVLLEEPRSSDSSQSKRGRA